MRKEDLYNFTLPGRQRVMSPVLVCGAEENLRMQMGAFCGDLRSSLDGAHVVGLFTWCGRTGCQYLFQDGDLKILVVR